MSGVATFREDLFAGQTALVTGAGRGIGAEVARAFAATGARVVLHDIDEMSLSSVAGEMRGAGHEVATIAGDLSRPEEARSVIPRAVAAFGALEVLVNNAGRSWAVTTEAIDETQALELVQLNQMAVLCLSQAFIAHRRSKGGGGSIIQISSTAGIAGFGERAVYCATKHAVQGLTRVLAIDHAAEGIRVNAILPHVIESPMFRTVARPEEVAAWSSGIPMQRLGTPADVAGAALFLCSPAAEYITGSSLVLDGGAMAG